MSELLCVHLPGGPALDYALPKLRAVASTTILPLVPLSPTAARTAAECGVHVLDPVALRGEQLVEHLVMAARAARFDGLIGLGEFAQITVARAAQRLGLPGPGPNILRSRDKLQMRLAWQDAGVPNPRFRPVHNEQDVIDAVTAFGEPVLLKSRTSAGSIGHAVVRDASSAFEAWRAAQGGVRRAKETGMTDPSPDADPAAMMVETLIPASTHSWYEAPGYGDYLSIEGMVVQGRYHPVCITGRLPTIFPFTELSNQAPCVLAEPLQRIIEAQARRAVDALGLETCGTHTEMKLLEDNQLCLLESAARLGGAMVTRQVEVAFGVDLITELARAVLGEPARLPSRMLVSADRAAASVALIATGSGGKPWRRLPTFDQKLVEQSGLISSGSRAEVVAAQSIATGAEMPAYDPAAGVLNFAGLLFLQATDPATLLDDTYSVLDGLEGVLTQADNPTASLDRNGATTEEVIELFVTAELNGPLTDVDRMRRMLEEAQDMVFARATDGTLVGMIRVLTDFSFNAFIADLAVLPGWQRRGIGSRLVEAATSDYPGVKFIVHPGHESGPFWSSLGFDLAPTCMAKPRNG